MKRNARNKFLLGLILSVLFIFASQISKFPLWPGLVLTSYMVIVYYWWKHKSKVETPKKDHLQRMRSKMVLLKSALSEIQHEIKNANESELDALKEKGKETLSQIEDLQYEINAEEAYRKAFAEADK